MKKELIAPATDLYFVSYIIISKLQINIVEVE